MLLASTSEVYGDPEVHPQVETTIKEEFQGVVSEITSSWEDGADGHPVLVCRTTTVGKKDVCDQRSRVETDSFDRPARLHVETRLKKTPTASVVSYDRVYEYIESATAEN